MSMPANRLNPLALSEVLDQSLQVFRRAWRPLVTMALIGGIPELLGTILALANYEGPADQFQAESLQQTLLQVVQGGLGEGPAGPEVNPLFSLLTAALTPLITGATVAISAHTYLAAPISLSEAFRTGRSRYWPLLGTNILAVLLAGLCAVPLALFLFVSPWLGGLLVGAGLAVAMVLFLFTDHAVVLEEASGGMPAIRRSYALVKARFWPLLLATVVFAVIEFVAGFTVDLATGMLQSLVLNSSGAAILLAVMNQLAALVLSTFTMAGVTVLYYDARVRQEGFDMTACL